MMVETRLFNDQDPEERRLFVEWMHAARDENGYNPDIFAKNQATILTCHEGGRVLGFVPLTMAALLEVSAFKPGLTPDSRARCFLALQRYLVKWAGEKNVPNAFFMTPDEKFAAFATQIGWREVEIKMLKLHFDSLESERDDD
jgi:hypothetical protein